MKNIYFVGIKGVAMTALAVYFKQQGYEVTGSDVAEPFATDEILKNHNIPVLTGFDPTHIDKTFDTVIVTGAHGGMTNVEAKRAVELGIPTFMHGMMLGNVMEGKMGISVAGCHGKTTTTAMIASLLTHAQKDPSYAVGVASINGLGSGGHFGQENLFVAEADEYVTCPMTDKTPRFLWQHPKVIVLTNIEYDHPDVYKDIEETKTVYIKFVQNIPADGLLIACIDNEHVRQIVSVVKRNIVTYGYSENADYRISNTIFEEGKSTMQVIHQGQTQEISVGVPGKHNLLNALGAAIAAHIVGVSWEEIATNSQKFTGTKRRFELIKKVGETLLYDDYAHHPSEIQATLAAARAWFPTRRIIAIFQPHTFSRTKALLTEFSTSFSDADVAIITDIYPSAREAFDESISSKDLVEKMGGKGVLASTKEATIEYLGKNIHHSDIIITLGAGDIASWHPAILEVLTSKLVK